MTFSASPPRLFARFAVLAFMSAIVAVTLLPQGVHAQYFGRNKVQYETFDWRIMATEHFDIHYYPETEAVTRDASQMSERWHTRLSSILGHQLTQRRSLIYYADHPDFQQTNVVDMMLGEGTGGVTEGLRTRVVLPYTGVYASTDHVVGHELVHVFQYDIAQSRQGGLARMAQLPLWVMEGMAEYLSGGREDPHTAMWMRDAIHHDRIPTIRQLSRDPRFFPYRYGQAVWAYIGGRFGDESVGRMYRNALTLGFERGIQRTLNVTHDTLSAQWAAATRAHYQPTMEGRSAPDAIGRTIFRGPDGRGQDETNVGPVLSPNGQYFAFFSSRGLFSIEIYVAETATGRVITRLTSPGMDRHSSALSFLYSAGSWSPDGRRFASVVYAEGDNQIYVLDVESRRIVQRIRPAGVGAITSPAWSPDGRTIAFSGQVGGQSDLFLFDVASGDVRRLTNDRYADLQPQWSPDGRTIAFVTDRGPATDFDRLTYAPMRIALFDVQANTSRIIDLFDNVKHINPHFSPDGTNIYFVSDREGFSDVYRVDLNTNEIYQITRAVTGISGYTNLSPAMTVASREGGMMLSVFERGGYRLAALTPQELTGTPVSRAGSGIGVAGILPPMQPQPGIVATYLADPLRGLHAQEQFEERPYRSRIGLQALGSPAVGVTTGGPFGTQVGGGVSALFGDELGDRRVGAMIIGGGDVQDIGGQAMYLNMRRRFNWVAGVGRIPYVTGYTVVGREPRTIGGQTFLADVYQRVIERVADNNVSTGAQYPLSITNRFEVSAEARHISFRRDLDEIVVVGGQVVDRNRVRLPTLGQINLGQTSAAYVGDNSFFGFTSPIAGWRYRFEVAPVFGDLAFTQVTADWRRYLHARPFTLAVRGLHFARYGGGGEDPRLPPLFLGYNTIMRGYSAESFRVEECVTDGVAVNACPAFDRLVGSRIAVTNAEIRIPLIGPGGIGLIPSNAIAMEFAPFFDGGMAWTRDQSPDVRWTRDPSAVAVPVFSAGLTTRTNLFGFAVLEIFYAVPFQRPDRAGIFGFQLAPGW